MKNTKQRFQDKANQMIEEHGGGGDFAKFMKEEVKKAVEETTPAEKGEEAMQKEKRIRNILGHYEELIANADETRTMIEDEMARVKNEYTLEELEEYEYNLEKAKYGVGDINVEITEKIIWGDK